MKIHLMYAVLEYTIVRFFYQPSFTSRIRLKNLETGFRHGSYRDWQKSEYAEVSKETSS